MSRYVNDRHATYFSLCISYIEPWPSLVANAFKESRTAVRTNTLGIEAFVISIEASQADLVSEFEII